ncbi:hypothetical protein HHK36_005518 [Tetracentron sinense]|uniref:Uncharacterized protein n=1 Tax=Tetracentron sinense TaxID=13715 RepID=A0A835DR32_TETSI|nr:hypothetical protein HHK36_005518 [Tetracentron sinense]
MGGGGAMRVASKVSGFVINGGLRGSPLAHVADQSVTSAARKSSRPVAASVSSSVNEDGKSSVLISSQNGKVEAAESGHRPSWDLDDWEFAGDEEELLSDSVNPIPRVVFGGVPTLEEAEEATSELKDALENSDDNDTSARRPKAAGAPTTATLRQEDLRRREFRRREQRGRRNGLGAVTAVARDSLGILISYWVIVFFVLRLSWLKQGLSSGKPFNPFLQLAKRLPRSRHSHPNPYSQHSWEFGPFRRPNANGQPPSPATFFNSAVFFSSSNPTGCGSSFAVVQESSLSVSSDSGLLETKADVTSETALAPSLPQPVFQAFRLLKESVEAQWAPVAPIRDCHTCLNQLLRLVALIVVLGLRLIVIAVALEDCGWVAPWLWAAAGGSLSWLQGWLQLGSDFGYIQSVVASLACDKSVWNAVMQNEKVMEFFQSQKTSSSHSPVGDIAINESFADNAFQNQESSKNIEDMSDVKHSKSSGKGFMGFLQNIKLIMVEMVSNLSGFFQNIFGDPGAENISGDANSSATPTYVNVIEASFMALAVLAIMVVVLKRG